MDRYWEANLWQPTIINDGGSIQPFDSLLLTAIKRCRESLREYTKALALFPYTPYYWRIRSAVLLKLGYPELAAADAYKALVLTTHVFDGKCLGSRVWLEMGMAVWYRDAVKEVATFAHERDRILIYEQSLSDEVKWMKAEMGAVWSEPYPWASGFHTRTKRSIKAANVALKKCSKVTQIQPSTVAVSNSDGVSYGMFASQDIHEGDIIIEHSPVLSITTCKQGGGHPLQHALVADLSNHEGAAQDPWSLEIRIIQPLKILEMLGIDIFANQWYDTWVLETLWQIFRVNSAGEYNAEDEYGCWIDGLYAVFNHSCEEPRMLCTYIQDFDRAGSKFQYCALREIKKGEEVCVNYIEVLSASKMERRKALASWLSGDCRCKRCLAE
ncbi:hypothetical protein BOTNAR_0308g00130 [Botryotinia narcissicola]|uniref:SET domain-containing protein n=1 Tax=Botryotinia narcissicola TaxID=278944 RepID=A0A4Z1HUX6_9HELO|nr:hypothetical protein BOTNAR_0308g00130 [Botryotinia narcissicola]